VRLLQVCFLGAALLGAAFAAAERPHRVVIEVNVGGKTPYGVVLNNAANLRRAFAPEPVRIEVVCHGPGVDLLFARNNPLAKRVAALARGGASFAACANTLRGRKIARTALLPFVRVVPSGVAQIVRRQEEGWSYLKGGF
jgi:uncharacterized protein